VVAIPSGEPLWRPLVRLVLSVGISTFATAALWRAVPDKLSVSSTIVGYPLFAGFDIYRYTYGYAVLAYLFPACAAVVYQLLAWKGPVRYRGRERPPVFPLVTVVDLEGAHSKPAPDDRVDRSERSDRSGRAGQAERAEQVRLDGVVLPLPPEHPDGPRGTGPPPDEIEAVGPVLRATPVDVARILGRLALAASAVALELLVVRSPTQPVPWWEDALAAGCYVTAVLVAALVFHGTGARGLHAPRSGPPTFRGSLARANSLLALVTLPLLYLVSQSTTVARGSQSRLIHYPWLPAWVAGLATAVGLGLWIRADRRARSTAGRRSLEAKVLTWVCGPVVLFMLVAVFPGALGSYQAFDDAQHLASPQLIFQHGLFPWRDIYVLHGLLEDVFDGKIGMLLFGNTRWGSSAGISLIVYPVNVIAVYLFAAYFSRKNRLVLVGVAIALICGQFIGITPRFLLLPLFLICFEAVVRRPDWARCWLFMTTLIAGAILTPEAILFAPCILIPLVVFEATGRRRGQSVVSSFPRTIRCAVAGVVLAVAWFAFLAATGSLSAFVDYYRVFSNGHILEGGIPANLEFGTQLMDVFLWTAPVALWLATVWRVVAKLRLRRVWSVVDWVMMAAAAISVVYFAKALDRADAGHMSEAFSATVPLLILWTIEVLSSADRWVRSALSRLPDRFPGRRWQHVVTVIAVLAVVVGTQVRGPSIDAAARQVQGNFHPTLPVGAVSVMPRLGYTVPGTVDTAQIRTLGAMLDRYAGPSAPVYDYSNQLGIVYYLLNRVPGTRYYYAAVVQSELAQQQVIAQLQESRPPVVVFTDSSFGLPGYDLIPQELRSYLVSSYLYAHYQPLLSFQGQLLLIRKDLAATAPPVPPGFNTSGLYFAGPACTFGDIPNYFPGPADSPPRPELNIPVTQTTGFTTTISGWTTGTPLAPSVTGVVAVHDGRVVGTSPPLRPRPDVVAALHDPAALDSGFTINMTTSTSRTFALYAMHTDGTVSPLAPTPGPGRGLVVAASYATITTPDGVSHRVFGTDTVGHVDSATQTAGNLITLHLPPGTSTTSYTWLRLEARAPFGSASFALTDQPGSPPGHFVEFNSLPRVGNRLDVRVGSCLQWQGYGSTGELFLQRQATTLPPITSATFLK